ncbi:MAG: 1-phosphofructokinase family hexose kinase [Chitinophagales bacterium]
MPAVVTITFNPCIDKSIHVDTFIPEKKMHCDSPRLEPGGGGINVARGISRLGGDVAAIFFDGGEHGRLLTNLLWNENIPAIPIHINENTRESWMIYEESTNRQYRFIMPGPMVRDGEWKEFLSELEALKAVEYIVISGSMPLGVPPNIFELLGDIALQKKAKLIVDSSGESLHAALRKGVFMIKPNQNELASLVATFGLDDKSVRSTAKDIIARDYCEIVVVSLGASGAILVSKDRDIVVNPPNVKARSTVGAGDSMVAGLIQSFISGRSLEESIMYGVACGTAATMNPGTELFHPDDVAALYQRIQREYINHFK